MPIVKTLAGLVLVSSVMMSGCKRGKHLSQGEVSFLFQLTHPSQKGLDAMLQAVRLRLSLMGRTGARVSARGEEYIAVELRGITRDEAQDVEKALMQPARLAFSSVENRGFFFDALKNKLPPDGSVRLGFDSSRESDRISAGQSAYLVSDNRDKLEGFLAGIQPPAGTKFWIMPGQRAAAAYLLKDPPQIENSVVRDVSVIKEQQLGRVLVSIQLDEKHQSAFAELTRKHLHGRLAVLIDRDIRSLPTVEAVIQEARLQIEPSPVAASENAEREAHALAAGIRAWGCAGGMRLVKKVIPPGS